MTSGKSTKIIDKASDEITKHFNKTLHEINSIIRLEEQNENKNVSEKQLEFSKKDINVNKNLEKIQIPGNTNNSDKMYLSPDIINKRIENKSQHSNLNCKLPYFL